MSTTIGYVADAIDTNYLLEVYTGSGGVALFIYTPASEPPVPASKFWLDTNGVRDLIWMLQRCVPEELTPKDGGG